MYRIKNCAVFTAAFVIASLPKPVYIPMIALALLFRPQRFKTVKRAQDVQRVYCICISAGAVDVCTAAAF